MHSAQVKASTYMDKSCDSREVQNRAARDWSGHPFGTVCILQGKSGTTTKTWLKFIFSSANKKTIAFFFRLLYLESTYHSLRKTNEFYCTNRIRWDYIIFLRYRIEMEPVCGLSSKISHDTALCS